MKAYNPSSRVVVTGIGIITSIGDNPQKTWNAITQSRSGISILTNSNNPVPAGQVDLKTKTGERSETLAHMTVENALQDSGIDLEKMDPQRIGVTVSSSKGGIAEQLSKPQGYFLEKVNLKAINTVRSKGPCLNIVAACATGQQSIQLGMRWIQADLADIVIAGASESVLNPFCIGAYGQAGILAKYSGNMDCKTILKPFDRRRSGTVLGEGSGVVILETLERAQKRRAKIYAEILSYFNGVDPYHPLQMDPSGAGVTRAIKKVITDAKISKGQIDYINLHGTGTVWNDLVETRGVRAFFGEESQKISLSSTKPFTGHVIGASGVVEFILSVLAMQNHFVPPTLNLEEPDPECDLDYTPLYGKEKNINTFICLSYGFGGHVAALLARSFTE